MGEVHSITLPQAPNECASPNDATHAAPHSGDQIWFAGDKNRWIAIGVNNHYIICGRVHKGAIMTTIIDRRKGIRGSATPLFRGHKRGTPPTDILNFVIKAIEQPFFKLANQVPLNILKVVPYTAELTGEESPNTDETLADGK